MKSVLSANRIKSAENFTINELGIEALILMERAAVEVAFSVMEKYPDKGTKILIVCGAGNNGADGLCVARLLVENGYLPYVFSKPAKTELHKKQFEILTKINSTKSGNVCFIDSDIDKVADLKYDVVVDALYGIGINRPLSDEDVNIINAINSLGAYVVSVDIPSGLDSTTGAVYNASVSADETICLGAYKKGLLIGEGPDYSGAVKLKNIGIFHNTDDDDYILLESSDIRNTGIIRRTTANKGTYGKTLVIAGNDKIYGAAYLSAKAALSSGAGMVKVFTHEANRHSLEHDIPEAMFSFYKDTFDTATLNTDISWSKTIVLGPGLGTGEMAVSLVKAVINRPEINNKILIIDADALNIISGDRSLFETLAAMIKTQNVKCVITPHKRELSGLMRLFDDKYSEEEFCKMLYFSYSIVVINKDANTRIFGKRTYINGTGNDGMATAGSGDVLAGILGGLLFRIDEDFAKACAVAVWLHGMCGDLYVKAHNPMTLTATGLLEYISAALDFLT